MLLLGILFISVPIIIWGLWIFVFENNPNASQLEKVKIYDSYLPKLMNGNFELSLVTFISSLIAIVFAATSVTNASVIRKIISIIIIIAGLLIMLLQLFSLM